MYKAYKFRMYPNNEQRNKLNSFIGTSRFIYNYYLDKKISMYKELKTTYSLKDMKKDLVPLQEEFEWLKDCDSCILRTSLEDLDSAYESFFKLNSGFPRFKSKRSRNSYRTNCIRSSYKNSSYSNIKIDLENHLIKLPKISNIKIRGYRNLKEFNKKIINATISKEAGRYYVSVLVEEDDLIKEDNVSGAIGLDLGVKDLVITSDGIKYNKMYFIERMEKRLKGLHKALSRSKKDSNNRNKLILKIQRLYLKTRNARKYYTHKITSQIVKENHFIFTEDLSVKDMLENSSHKLSHCIQNSAFRMILNELEYKCKWNKKIFIKINKYFPSSKICGRCGNKYEELELKERKWKCKYCGCNNDRDLNASMNILFEGIKMYYNRLERYE